MAEDFFSAHAIRSSFVYVVVVTATYLGVCHVMVGCTYT